MLRLARKFMGRLIEDKRGLTAVEYAVLGAMVVAAIGVAGLAFEPALEQAFTSLLPGAS